MPDEQNTASRGSRPVGRGEREVAPGECVISIAEETGHYWKKLWDHPDNEDIKDIRKDPNVLLAGDRIHIPPIKPKDESGATEKRHVFRRKGVPSVLRLKCAIMGVPLANKAYSIEVDGKYFTGHTDSDGGVNQAIPCGAKSAVLKIGSEPDLHVYELNLGGMDPVETITGQKSRLNNLGYTAGTQNDEATPDFVDALRHFQEDNKLTINGLADEATQSKLKDLTC